MFSAIVLALAAASLLLPAPAEAQQQSNVVFARGANSITLRGQIRGDADHRYIVDARAGQMLTVVFKPTNASAYFNIVGPQSRGEAMFAGSSNGNRFAGRVPVDGAYVVLVYLMRNAARRNEVANYTLSIRLHGGPPADLRPHGDALVPGTRYNATAEIPCVTSAGGRPGTCRAGVIRRRGGTATVELKTPDGGQRRIYFQRGQATGSDAAARFAVRRQGDLQIIRIGLIEVYRVPDAFVVGD